MTDRSKLRSATKCFLFSINLVTFIFGLVLFFLGVVLQTRYARYWFQESSQDDNDAQEGGGEAGIEDDLAPPPRSSYYNLAAWCTAMGVVVCVVSFLGERSKLTFCEER